MITAGDPRARYGPITTGRAAGTGGGEADPKDALSGAACKAEGKAGVG